MSMDENRKKQQEFDLVEALQKLWSRRRFILKVAGAAALLGLVIALSQPTRYTATSVMVPQTGENISGGNLQGLAAMAGINIGSQQQGSVLSPLIYPMIVSSVPFQKELMYSRITVEGHREQVTLLDYFTDLKYQKFSLFRFLGRYTVGLPGLILNAGRRREPDAAIYPEIAGVATLTPRENECRRALSGLLFVKVNQNDGYVSLSASMPQPLAAAQLAARAQELLEEYITRFKVQKVQADLDFIEERYLEVKADFEAKQRALAHFQDKNLDISSAVARTRESRLSDEYNLAFSIYSELARQREQAGIKVKEDTPVFTIVEPVTIPGERAAPRRMTIVVVSILAGLAVGAALVFILPSPTRTPDPGQSGRRHRRGPRRGPGMRSAKRHDRVSTE